MLTKIGVLALRTFPPVCLSSFLEGEGESLSFPWAALTLRGRGRFWEQNDGLLAETTGWTGGVLKAPHPQLPHLCPPPAVRRGAGRHAGPAGEERLLSVIGPGRLRALWTQREKQSRSRIRAARVKRSSHIEKMSRTCPSLSAKGKGQSQWRATTMALSTEFLLRGHTADALRSVNSRKDVDPVSLLDQYCRWGRPGMRIFLNGGTPWPMAVSSEFLWPRIHTWKASSQQNCSKLRVNGHPLLISISCSCFYLAWAWSVRPPLLAGEVTEGQAKGSATQIIDLLGCVAPSLKTANMLA